MLDFVTISHRITKDGKFEIYPKFIIKRSKDLMIRGGDFYAIWNEELGRWSTDEQDAIFLIDKASHDYVRENQERFGGNFYILKMWDAETGMIDRWHRYVKQQLRDNFHMLDETLIFSNTESKKDDYASKSLSYPLEEGPHEAYNKLMYTLYDDDELHKIEWSIGAIVSGGAKTLQKFLVLYGSAGTGKSTVLNIVEQLFGGYFTVFDSKALGSTNASFALEPFKANPLVAIEHDGDLSRIEDNTRLNSLVSHEIMTVNEKFKSAYSNRFKCFLMLGTNKPVKITDAKSGLIRRLIDVTPSGRKLPVREYNSCVRKIEFELGAIAHHCMSIFLEDPFYYDDYIPTEMIGATNDFYNYVIDHYHIFKKNDGTTLKAAWEQYKVYCEEARVPYPLSQRLFKEELKNYFDNYDERFNFVDGTRVRSYYSGFKHQRFNQHEEDYEPTKPKVDSSTIHLISQGSILDDICGHCKAQYATKDEIPGKKWDSVKTTLSDLDTSKLHYVQFDENHIVIDFDLKDASGEKSLSLNLEAISSWPPTYTEISKGGNGIHLHYIYSGDVSSLSGLYDENIEIKVCSGNSSIRRRLTLCNDLPIATISSGLPLKGEKMIDLDRTMSEKSIRTMISRNLAKEYHSATKPSIDFIHKILEDAYESGLVYDVSDMKPAITTFASRSTNQAMACIKIVKTMKFASETASEPEKDPNGDLIFFDVEVFPNLFVLCYKKDGENEPIIGLINPSPIEIEPLLNHKLVGFNNRKYDNHILYARLLGYTNDQLYRLSQDIISNKKSALFREAYGLSHTDIYDFSSKKQSLKKFCIELGYNHLELGLPWDQPVHEDLIPKVVEYCKNDVGATEATFYARGADYVARLILAELSGLTANDTTNTLSARIIFGKNKTPQSQFNYRNMGEVTDQCSQIKITNEGDMYVSYGDEFTLFDEEGRPVFPGYKFEAGVSTYRGETVGEGGYVYAEPGIYENVRVYDVASMHPTSIIEENLFGDKYTQIFRELVAARVAIKRKNFEYAKTLLNGMLAKYLNDESIASDLAMALKIVINSIYGLTAARFDNPFRDPRNLDNIVAKRGALFMLNLKYAVQEKGYNVIHIKTDSIKIENPTEEIEAFILDYGKQYGYTFEVEDAYSRMCLVNDAVYVALHSEGKEKGKWTATGTQFSVPYVFKSLFSEEELTFDDFCEVKSVSSGTIFLDMQESLPNVELIEKELDDRQKGKKKLNPELTNLTNEQLEDEARKGHNYVFVGRTGRFTPVVPGAGGGHLLRQKDGKYYAVTGTKGYLWMESEMVQVLGLHDKIDREYYDNLVNGAIETISKFGNVLEFTQ